MSDVNAQNLSIDLKCPITMSWLDDPITVPCCGKAFSRDPLVQWLRGSSQCPCCQSTLVGFDAENAPHNTTLANVVEAAQQLAPMDPNALQSGKVHRHQWTAEFRPIKTGYNIGKLNLSLADGNFSMRKSLLVLMVDNSGSMSGFPSNQARAAMTHIHGMSQLNKNVHVDLIEYHSRARLLDFTPSNIAKFTGVGGTYFRSSFKVLSELLRGYICSDKDEDKDKPNNIGSVSVAFMTDGQDSGDKSTLVSDFRTVLEDCWLQKEYDLTVHTIGFGRDCNKTLLEGMRTAGNIDGTFRYAEPTDGDDALCQKITDIYDISSQGTSKVVTVKYPDHTSTARINTNELGNGHTQIWLQSCPHTVTIDSEVDNGIMVPVKTNNSDMIISRTLKEWCAVLIDQLASVLMVFQKQQNSPNSGLTHKLVTLFCGLIEQRICELREHCDEVEYGRLDFISQQLKAFQAGTSLDIGRLSDMRFSSMFVNSREKTGSNRKGQDNSVYSHSVVPMMIESETLDESDLKHYSRLSKGKKRNPLQELICQQEYDILPNITPDLLTDESLSHKDKDGNTALMLAAHAGHSKIVKLILNEPSFKLSPDAENTDGESALTMAIKKRGFEATIRELAMGGALLPIGRKKGLERYAIDHHWTRAVGFISNMSEAGQTGAIVTNYSMDETMTPEYMRYLYIQSKNSERYNEFKDSYLPLFLGKGPTVLKDLIEELLESGVKPDIEQLTTYCYPKRTDTTTQTCIEYLELAQLLIKYNSKLLIEKNDNGETGLYMAVKRGSKPHLKWILKQPNVDIEAENKEGATPLWSACYRGRRSFIEILLDHGADITHRNVNGNIPIYGPCERGPREVAELLISSGSPIEHYNNNGDTLILIACRNGQTDVVECLLEYVSEEYANHISVIDDFNAVMACAEVGYGECIKVLYRYGFDLGAKTPTEDPKVLGGATAMHIASYYGKTEAIAAMLECGADPNVQDKDGCTPLHIAVIQGYVPAITLLRSVSDITIKDCVGNTAMAYCRNREDIRDLLIDPGLDGLMKLSRGCFTQDEHVRAIAMLQSHKGVFGGQRFLNIRDHDGKSPILEATLHGDYLLVKRLLELGASAGVPDIHGMYPMTWAKHNRNHRMVTLLDPYTSLDVSGKVSLQLSELKKHSTGPDTSILFLGKPVGDHVQMTDSGLISRMANTPPVPSPIDETSKAFARELPILCSSNDTIVQYFKDPRFEALQNTRFLWNAKAFTVSVCANQNYLVPRHVLSIAMYTNNPIVPEVINSALETQTWNTDNETIKNYSSVLMQGLRALPCYEGEVFVGLEAVNRDQYRVGKEFTWNRFISCSTLWRVAMEGTPSFTTKSRKGVIFAIRSKTGRLVNMCSQYGFDSELMFMPYTKFRVYDWFHGDPIALGQANIRAHSYHVRDESVSWMTTEQMVTSNKALIIAIEEII